MDRCNPPIVPRCFGWRLGLQHLKRTFDEYHVRFIAANDNLDTANGFDIMSIFRDVLSFVAENERTNIRQRQAEGIAAAKAKGVRFGRPPAPLPENFHHLYQQWKNGKITGTAAAKLCGMPLSTFRYRAEIYEKAKLL